MNDEQELVKRLVERMKVVDWVAKLIRFNEEGKADPPTKEAFWKHLVLCLLTTQQRSTAGSQVDLFEKRVPFPLELEAYRAMGYEEVLQTLKSFRFGKPVTRYLQINHRRLFEKDDCWPEIQASLELLQRQRNSDNAPAQSHKVLERKVARRLADHLDGIGPKQSRNLLQWLGLTRYEIPLDSRVTGWLGDNLGWNISFDSLNDNVGYEFWLDRLQSVCDGAGILPTVFDAAAFEEGKIERALQNPANRIGYVNKSGQVVVRNTDLCNPDKNRAIYMLGCSYCGQVYGAAGSDIVGRKCPKCQDGAPGLAHE